MRFRGGVEEVDKRLYLPEFGEEAVRLLYASHERWPDPKIAPILGLSLETLRKKLVNQAEIDADSGTDPRCSGAKHEASAAESRFVVVDQRAGL